MSEHTPEPWAVREWAGDEWPQARVSIGPERVGRHGIATAVAISPRYATPKQSATDFRRITACVNACAGIPTEDLEACTRYYSEDDRRMNDTFVTNPVRYKLTERDQHVQFKLLDDLATPPNRATNGSAGWDLYNADGEYVIKPGFRTRIRTGVSVAIPEGWCGQVWPRSGMAFAHGYDTMAGLIDNDYRREIMVLMINHGKQDMAVQKGDRIAQMVVVPCLTTSYIVDELPEPASKHDGWGSSGK